MSAQVIIKVIQLDEIDRFGHISVMWTGSEGIAIKAKSTKVETILGLLCRNARLVVGERAESDSSRHQSSKLSERYQSHIV